MTSSQEQRDAVSSEAAEPRPLEKRIDELQLLLGRATARVQKLETELEASRAQVAWFHRQLFGQKAEKVRPEELESAWLQFLNEQEAQARSLPTEPSAPPPFPGQLTSVQFIFGFLAPRAGERLPGEPEPQPPDPGPTGGAAPPPGPVKGKRKGHGRKRVPPTLRQEVIVLEPDQIPEGARRVGEEVSHRYAIRPAELVHLLLVRPKYALDAKDGEKTEFTVAEMPHEMIPRGLLSSSGLAHVVAAKWDRHVPYNRMSRFFNESSFPVPVSTLSGTVIRAAEPAKTLVEAMKVYAQQVAPYVAIDATGVLVQQPEVCHRGHVWVRYVEKTAVFISFTRTHDSLSAGAQLEGWNCPTLCDGAQVFDLKLRETGNPRGGCWSHARRKLVYAIPSDPRALVGLHWINEIFEIERELAGATPEQRLAERQRRSAPLIQKLFDWRDVQLAHGNLGRGTLAKALRYLRNQESRLLYFLGDGNMPMHNNHAELQARHLAVGRKAWLFFGSEKGAEAAATWLTLVLSARMHELHVETYLRDLFRVLPSWPKSRVLELAPHRWLQTRAKLDAGELAREIGPIKIPP